MTPDTTLNNKQVTLHVGCGFHFTFALLTYFCFYPKAAMPIPSLTSLSQWRRRQDKGMYVRPLSLAHLIKSSHPESREYARTHA